MKLILGNRRPIINPSSEELRDALTRVYGSEITIAILEDDTESYIQAGGGADGFTVELRITAADGTFQHWKARRKESTDRRVWHLKVGGQSTRVDLCQILPRETMTALFESCLSGIALSPEVEWEDVTHMFLRT